MAPVEPGQARQQAAGVRMVLAVEHADGVAVLDDPPGVHHVDPLGEPGDDAEVVGDEHDGEVAVALHVGEHVEDLGLDRHVEGGRRLVGDQQLGIVGERHRDHHPLAHPARTARAGRTAGAG